MKLLRLIKKDLIKIFTNAGLLIGIGLGVALVLFANIYTDGTGKGYYTITALSTFSKSEMIDNGMYSENLMSMILIQALPIYGVVIAAFATTLALGGENNNSMRQFTVTRSGKNTYVLSKALVTMFASAIVFAVIGIVTMLICKIGFPSRPRELSYSKFGYVQCIAGITWYGAMMGGMAYLCSAFFSNIYLKLCFPFFVGYLHYVIANIGLNKAVMGNTKFADAILNSGYVDYFTNYYRLPASYLVRNILIFLGVWILAILINRLQLEKIHREGDI